MEYNIMLVPLELLLLLVKILYDICNTTYRFCIPMKKKNVTGEIVLITGAGHGIGKELAKRYASLGATVVCWDINQENNEQTMNEIKETGRNSVYAYQCDVTNNEEVIKVAEKVKKDVGDVTILINNAGIAPCRTLLNYNSDEINQTINVNLKAHYWTLKAFLPSMIEKNHGHVVAVSSLLGFVALSHGTLYCTTKFGIRAMMNSLRDEVCIHTNGKSSVKFTTVYPFLIDTGLAKKPKAKYSFILNLKISPRRAAALIIDAQRQNFKERSIPSFWMPLIMILKNLPNKSIFRLIDFLGLGIDEDD